VLVQPLLVATTRPFSRTASLREGVPIVTRNPAILAHGPATIW
jgi:hypothetical protein